MRPIAASRAVRKTSATDIVKFDPLGSLVYLAMASLFSEATFEAVGGWCWFRIRRDRWLVEFRLRCGAKECAELLRRLDTPVPGHTPDCGNRLHPTLGSVKEFKRGAGHYGCFQPVSPMPVGEMLVEGRGLTDAATAFEWLQDVVGEHVWFYTTDPAGTYRKD